MDRFLKLKAIAILVCGGVVGSSIAASPAATNKISNDTKNSKVAAQAAKPTDAMIASGVKSAISDYAGKVSLSIKGGVVSLAGEVASDADYEKVITAAQSVKGVSDVIVDKLTVKNSSIALYDTYMTAKIKGSLIQSGIMTENIPGWSIHVVTKYGQVYLTGNVASQAEKQHVVNAVKAVKGVNKIDDKIQINVAMGLGAPGIITLANVMGSSNNTDASANDDSDSVNGISSDGSSDALGDDLNGHGADALSDGLNGDSTNALDNGADDDLIDDSGDNPI